MGEVKAIPDGYPRVSAYLSVNGAADAIDFYTSVLGFTERVRMPAPGGKVGHAELQLGDSVVMLADEFPGMGPASPQTVGGSPVTLTVYVEDVDVVFKRAIEGVPRSSTRCRTSSTATAPVSSRTRSGTAGTCRPTWRTCLPTRWRGGRRP